MTKVSAIITAHNEGLLAGPSIASFCEARSHAEANHIEVEPIFILDRADKLTEAVIREAEVPGVAIYDTDFGDISTARNFAASKATGDFVSYLDADDFWSYNWITEAARFCLARSKKVVAHSEINILFGGGQNVWIHADSEAEDFDPSYLTVGNYWDAMIFTWRDIYLDYPVRKNDLKSGFGYEDWQWNCVTLLAGIPHKPVPYTVHFKRRRGGSLLARSADSDVVPAHTGIYALSRKLWSEKSGRSA